MFRHIVYWTSGATLAAMFAFVAGCGGQSQQPGELLILCGTSFRDPVEKLTAEYEKQTGQRVELSFGGCEDLLPHVQKHVMGDLFVAHDPYMKYTEDNKALLRWVEVGRLRPVLVVAKGNPKNIKGLDDLARPGLQVALPDPNFSTAGKMVFAMLEEKNIKDAVLKNVGNAQFRAHADIGNQIKLGTCDAGIMWNGVAHNFADSVEIVPDPYQYKEQIRVGVIGLSYSKQPEQVEKFLKFAETEGKKVFAEYGYVK